MVQAVKFQTSSRLLPLTVSMKCFYNMAFQPWINLCLINIEQDKDSQTYWGGSNELQL